MFLFVIKVDIVREKFFLKIFVVLVLVVINFICLLYLLDWFFL